MFSAWGVSVGIPLPIAFAGSLGIGLVVGAVNGTIISKARINPLITTLATLSIVRGISYVLSGGKDVVLTDPTWLWLGSGSVMGIPVIVIVLVATFVVFGCDHAPIAVRPIRLRHRLERPRVTSGGCAGRPLATRVLRDLRRARGARPAW